MRIYQPTNEFGQQLLSTAHVVNSTKTITKPIADGKVEITKSDLGTDKASDWTVLEVVFGGNKIMADVTSTDDKITVTLDKEDSTFSGDVVVTLIYEASMNITEDAQQPPVVVQGAMIDADGNFIGKAIDYKTVKNVGTDADFSALTNGQQMFYGNTSLTSFTSDMPALTNGSHMFEGRTSLTSFSGDMPAMTNGEGMFNTCSKLTSFSGDIHALTNGQYMFYQCTSLTSFAGDMPALTNGQSMFSGCTSLTSFSGDLSALAYRGTYMFEGCISLTSFAGDTSKLNTAQGMFNGCSNLTSFAGDLPNLSNGSNMFSKCKLDLASVNRIATSIHSYTSGSHSITIGVDSTEVTEEEQATANTIIVGKGWTVNWQRN